MKTTLRSSVVTALFFLALFFLTLPSSAQTFNFRSIERDSLQTATQIKVHGLNDTIVVSHDAWDNMVSNSSSWGTNLKFKSVSDFVRFSVNYGYGPVKILDPYTLRLTYKIYGFSNPATPNTASASFNDTLTISYKPDSLATFQDKQYKKYSGYHKIMIVLTGLYSINGAGGAPTPISMTPSSLFGWLNFNVEGAIVAQPYNKKVLYNGSYKEAYGTSGALDIASITTPTPLDNLPVYWQMAGTTLNAANALPLNPVKYELEWTFVDDYKVDVSNNGAVSQASVTTLPYSFTDNATRVVLDTNYYKIPLNYQRGYVIYRVRMVRPDSINYEYPIYGPWTLPAATGTVSSVANGYKYYVPPHLNDSLNWQYTVSFAEQGKYKQVMSYYDGMLKNRQSITRFNSMPSKLIATEQVYDFEGRPTISILPTPITSGNFRYQPGLALNYNTGLPYRPQDFDTATAAPSVCPTDILLPKLSASSLANIYYSPSNPDQTGFQKYVPDAGGFPLVQTIYSPGYDDRVDKQGGAGDSLQIGHNHNVKNDYTATEQTDLDRLFGTNIGLTGYYRKTVSKDPNGQLSINVTNYKGKTMMSSMVGLPDIISHALVSNDNLSDVSQLSEDFLAGTPQQISGNQRIADKLFYNEAAGPSTAAYNATFSPFPTFCPGKYLSVEAGYQYSIINECGQYVIDTSQTHGTFGTTGVVGAGSSSFQGPTVPFFMEQGSHSLNKILTINTDDVAAAVDSFISLPGGQNCMKDEPWFIKQSVLSKQFPCPENYIDMDCPSCGSDKYEMMKELFPNLDSNYTERKYGIYKVLNGVVVGSNNSDFTLLCGNGLDPNHWATPYPDNLVELALGGGESSPYPGGFSINNWPTAPIGIGGVILPYGPYIVLNGNDTLHCKYRYQNSCVVTMPDTVIKYGNIYTHLQQIPVQDFINIFNDSIAASLLPMHPEYCSLLNCVDADAFSKKLNAIPDATIAEPLSLLMLSQIINADPVYTVMLNHPADFPNPYNTLAYLENGFLSLDTVALNEAYCNSTDENMLSDCQTTIFHSEISSGTLINPYVKNKYFQSIRKIYLANRKRFLYVLSPSYTGSVNCSLCQPVRMTLVPDPVFPNDDSIGVSYLENFLGSLSSNTTPPPTGGGSASALSQYNAAVNGVNLDTTMTVAVDPVTASIIGSDSMTIGPLQNIADSAINGYVTNAALIMQATMDSMMAEFVNCTPFGNLSTVRAYLQNLYNTGQVTNYTFTPDQVLAALHAGSINLDDLCNPYIVNYDGLATPPSQVNSGMNCNGQAFYNDVTSFLNTTSLLPLQHLGTAYPNIFFSGSGPFVQALVAHLGSHCTITATYNSSEHVYKLNYTSAGGSLNINIKAAASGLGATPFTPASGETVTLQADCYREIFGNFPSGYIGDLSFVVSAIHTTSSGAVATYKMKTWNDQIEMNDQGYNPISQCIPCTQIKPLYKQFWDTCTLYQVKATDHPYYSTMLKNFMTYSLKKAFTEEQYLDFIESCALTDSMRVNRHSIDDIQFSSTALGQTFLSNLNTLDPNVNIIPDFFIHNPANNYSELGINLNQIPKNKLRVFTNFMNTYPATANLANMRLGGYWGDNYMGPIFIPVSSGFTPSSVIFNGSSNGFTFNYVGPYSVWNGVTFEDNNLYNVISNTVNDPTTNARNIATLQQYLQTNQPATTYFPEINAFINSEYSTAEKQAYLKYNYRLQNLPPSQVLDSLEYNSLVNISPFSDTWASYGCPAAPNSIENLYYIHSPDWNAQPTPLDKLYYVMDRVSNQLGGSIFFTGNNTREITVGLHPGEKITAYRCRDTAFWYRYFVNGDTLFNFFVRLPAYIDTQYISTYIFSAADFISLGEGDCRSFTVDVFSNTAPISEMYLTGFTDFTLFKNKVLHNVLLTHQVNEDEPPVDTVYNCEHDLLNTAIYEGKLKYKFYVDSIRNKLYGDFYAYVMDTGITENLFISFNNQRFNYTLYNYDRAGNLATTIPPAGVNPFSIYSIPSVGPYRAQGVTFIPDHTKLSNYKYNSLNQVFDQATPDGGDVKFFYDAAGRVIFSQNDKQKPSGNMTYTLYDKQGRIIETGQAPIACPYFEPNTVGPGDSCYSYNASDGTYTPFPSVVFNLKTITHQSVINYVRSLVRNEVVYTSYDDPVINLGAISGLSDQENLRKRVATIKYFDFLQPTDTLAANYTYAMHFSYDIEGNVKTLTRDYPLWKSSNQQYKRIDYDYDVISGKVNMLSYNRSFADQFYQRYGYDADNRITKVETSNDGIVWDRDAEYQYYQHGPLARMSLGDLRVQGVDYAYTIQGWLKAVNGDLLDTARDMGGDGNTNAGSIHANDGVALSLDYFKGDYRPIGNSQVTHLRMPAKSLYNGNIPRATTAIAPFPDLASTYTYDQLNRIVRADYAGMHRTDTTLTNTANYYSSYAYDPDGNLQKLVRNGNKSGALGMDSLIYRYTGVGTTDNKLQNVSDYQVNNYTNDIKQNTQTWLNRYQYDPTGNVVKDLVSGQDTIQWNHYNKVALAASDTAGGDMIFGYDGAGNRYIKSVETDNGDTTILKSEYDVRDAQGNILAIYNDNSKYAMRQQTWITYITQQITQPCGPHYYIHAVLTPWYSQNGYFKASILHEAQLNASWAASQLSLHPVSFYMNHNSSIMTNMLYGAADYSGFYGKLAGYSNANNINILANAISRTATIWDSESIIDGLVYRDPDVDPNSSIFYTLSAYSEKLSDSVLNILGTSGSGDAIKDANTLSHFANSDPVRFMNVLTTLGAKSKFAAQYGSFLQSIFSGGSTLVDANNDSKSKPIFTFLCEYAPELLSATLKTTGLDPRSTTSGDCDASTALLLTATQSSPSALQNFVNTMDQLGQKNYLDEYANFLSNIFQNSGTGTIDDMQKRAVTIINSVLPEIPQTTMNGWGLSYDNTQPEANTNAIMDYMNANPYAEWDYIQNAVNSFDANIYSGDGLSYKALLDSVTLDSVMMQNQYFTCANCSIPWFGNQGPLLPIFQDALAGYTTFDEKTALANFYDTWTPSKWLLRKTVDTPTLLGTIYDLDAGSFMENYVTAVSNNYQILINGLNAIPHFSRFDLLHNLSCCVMQIAPCTKTVIDSIVHNGMVNGLEYQNLSLASHVMYGSSRLGTKDYLPGQIYDSWNNEGPSLIVDTVQLNGRRPWYSLEYNDDINGLSLAPWLNTDVSSFTLQHQIGQKQYELSNHLGNVQATISDLPYWGIGGSDYGMITRKSPAMASAYDYYPFGMLMPDRYVSDTSSHCVTVTQTKWVPHDTTICHDVFDWKWPNIFTFGLATAVSDGKTLTFTASTASDGIAMEISTVPNLHQTLNLTLASVDRLTSDSRLIIQQQLVDGTWKELTSTNIRSGLNSLGFVAVSTAPVRWYLSGPFLIKVGTVCATKTVLQQQTLLVDICNGDKDKYRFGYNGQEKVNEWAGIGNHNTAEFWEYDTRTGRRGNLDPDGLVWESPYATYGGNPIQNADMSGNKWYDVVVGATLSFLEDSSPMVFPGTFRGLYSPTDPGDYVWGLNAGDRTALQLGTVECILGAMGEGGGGGLTLSGVGAPAGIPLMVASAGVMAEGASSMIHAAAGMDWNEKYLREASQKPSEQQPEPQPVRAEDVQQKPAQQGQKANNKARATDVQEQLQQESEKLYGGGQKNSGCFITGTLVASKNGLIPIERIRKGDSVWAYNTDEKKIVLACVEEPLIKHADHLVKLTVNGINIWVTDEHPFFVNNGTWVGASHLQKGDLLWVKGGQAKIPVRNVALIDSSCTVYNIHVAKVHTYWVSALKLIVHNESGGANTNLSRSQAQRKAKDIAKVPRNGRGGEDIPMDELNETSRGRNYQEMKKNGATKLGRRSTSGKNGYVEHPDGHSDAGQPGIPEHHNSGHFHATDQSGTSTVIPYN